MLTQKSKVDGIKLHITLANDEITKAEVAKAQAEKDVKKLSKAVENNAAALEEATAELGQLDEEIAEVSKYTTDLRDQVARAQEAEENRKEDLDAAKQELDEQTAHIQEFRQKQVDITFSCMELCRADHCYASSSNFNSLSTISGKTQRRIVDCWSTGRLNTTTSSSRT